MEESSENPVKYEDLEPYTRLCVENFRTLMKRELSVKRAEEEFGKFIVLIPDKDLKGYVQITEQIREEYEGKMSKIDEKIHEIGVRRGIIKR